VLIRFNFVATEDLLVYVDRELKFLMIVLPIDRSTSPKEMGSVNANTLE